MTEMPDQERTLAEVLAELEAGCLDVAISYGTARSKRLFATAITLNAAQQKRITHLEFRAGERCLNCGKIGPCELDKEETSGPLPENGIWPGSPCTFDKSPVDMWVQIQAQQKRITELGKALDSARAHLRDSRYVASMLGAKLSLADNDVDAKTCVEIADSCSKGLRDIRAALAPEPEVTSDMMDAAAKSATEKMGWKWEPEVTCDGSGFVSAEVWATHRSDDGYVHGTRTVHPCNDGRGCAQCRKDTRSHL